SSGAPLLHIGANRLPLALNSGPGGGAISINDHNSFRLEMGAGQPERQNKRRRLLEDLSTPAGTENDLTSFVRRRQVQTLAAVDTLRELLEGPKAAPRGGGGLTQKLQLIAGLIARGFGTRIFYVNLDGFDTHSNQAGTHGNLLADLANAVGTFFQT